MTTTNHFTYANSTRLYLLLCYTTDAISPAQALKSRTSTPEIITMSPTYEAIIKAQELVDATLSSVKDAGNLLTAKKAVLSKVTRNLTAEIKTGEVEYNDLYRKLVEANRALKAATDEASKEQAAIREAAKAEAATAVANKIKEKNNNTGEKESDVECITIDD